MSFFLHVYSFAHGESCTISAGKNQTLKKLYLSAFYVEAIVSHASFLEILPHDQCFANQSFL